MLEMFALFYWHKFSNKIVKDNSNPGEWEGMDGQKKSLEDKIIEEIRQTEMIQVMILNHTKSSIAIAIKVVASDNINDAFYYKFLV